MVVSIVMVVDFCDVCSVSEIINAVGNRGRLIICSMLVRVLLMFDFISILLNIFLVLVIKIIIVVVGSVEFIMLLVCCKF